MTPRQPRYEMEEYARRGTEIYERQVRPKVEAGNRGRIVAIDIDSDDFELADDTLTASTKLLERRQDAQIWCVRIGYKAVRQLISFTRSRRHQ
jgi:hypothetical protein